MKRRGIVVLVLGMFAAGACADGGSGAVVGGTLDAGKPTSDASTCVPSSCQEQSAACGSVPDGCGGVQQCGQCSAGQYCGGAGPNRCGTEPCTAATCAELEAACGVVSDGCSAALQCGTCPPGASCKAGQCVQDTGCSTCASLNWSCGSGPDGCGSTLNCGSCAGTQSCVQHVCVSAGTGGSSGSGGSSGAGGSGGSGPASIVPVSVTIDGHPSGLSNQNHLLEPGETAVLAPAWKNVGAGAVSVQGTIGSFTCPSGATCTIADKTADYGALASGATANCHDATGDCYRLSVQAPGRPAVDWDVTVHEVSGGVGRTWTMHLGGSFQDVTLTAPYYKAAEALLHNGITLGCGSDGFCPNGPLVRQQAAVWLARVISGTDAAVPQSGSVPSLGGTWSCGAGGKSLFEDVALDATYCRHVHFLAQKGATAGCSSSPQKFCPEEPTSRGQAAALLARLLTGSDAAVPMAYANPSTGRSYDCSTSSPKVQFTDAGAGHAQCRHAHYMWARGYAAGCTLSTFCPAAELTRGDGAVWVASTFSLGFGPN